ncbi:Catechol oxidase [Handroanthus impetiginosus]|uniref:Catechol oxidase n=1 Tax=Handroanthus impetiginosus TaxID=429701 RepID=A0A2G9G0D2_9LAMI|nr:Catechol oxidase [Handroanthus impetiginosus]
MASLPLSFCLLPDFFTKPPHSPPRQSSVSCNAKDGGKLDRRNLLIGIGGFYGGANLVSSPSLAAPISAPDLSKCTTGTDLNTNQPLDVNCCPPPSEKITDYKMPPVTTLRFRPAAHLASKEYIAKYEKAVELMKALPDDDPRNFIQQANVHCAYCNLTYPQTGDSALKLQVHNSWLFYPWHRWYLYFYERILGKLIDDPTFGLPFWNWDNPDGMVILEMFVKNGSPLSDARRNPAHLPPVVADLNYSAQNSSDPSPDPSQIIRNNLNEMYLEMVRNAVKLEDFYGAKYVIGTEPDPGAGTRGSHTALHVWVGEPTTTGEDMGNFYSAGRDSIFFSHHANIDRLWSVWRGLRGEKPKEFTEPDWLNANFLFYDENKNLVRVKVKDTLENEKMGYTFQKVHNPWLTKRPIARTKKSKVATTSPLPSVAETVIPVKLDKVVKVLVDRPKKSRSKQDKEKEEELLVIEGIEVDTAKFPEELLDKAEYAGCYSQVPHKNSTKVKSRIRLALTELLEDLEVEDDDKILVSLVPKAGGEDISIGGIKIIYASE